MGTRGAFGVRIDGIDKIGYNQMDSYPTGRGIANFDALRDFIAAHPMPLLRTQASAVRVVTEDTAPTSEDIAALEPFTDLDVSSQSNADWYCLTRNTHGDILAALQCGYILDSAAFLLDSLFCEWAYILNLDTNELEVYKGFQTRKGKGRYAKAKPRNWTPEYKGQTFYYGVGLLCTFPLSEMPWTDFLAKVNARLPADEQEDAA